MEISEGYIARQKEWDPLPTIMALGILLRSPNLVLIML